MAGLVYKEVMGGRALVLGGGGVTGVAWEAGLIAGLADLGIDLAAADVIVGTSAGSVAEADLTSGQELEAQGNRGSAARRSSRPVMPHRVPAPMQKDEQEHSAG